MRALLSALGAFLGWLLWVLRVRRGVVMGNLRLAFPEKSDQERRAIGRAALINVGRMAPAFLFASRLTPEELERVLVYEPGKLERLVAATASGKGAVVCTAHFGNFESLAALHNLKGVPVTMIARPLKGGWFGRLWRGGRSRAGVQELIVERGGTLQAAQAAMRKGRVLGYVIDQNMSARRAIFPTFFGVPAATAPTPAYLALRGATVFFALDVPLEDGRHRVVMEGPLQMADTGDRDRDVLAFMQDLNDRLERWVRRYPEHWYWLHRRWKTRPPPGGAERRSRPRAAGPPRTSEGPAAPIDPSGSAG